MSDMQFQRAVLCCESCDQKATFHLTWAEDCQCESERHLCENHAKAVLSPYQPQPRQNSRAVKSMDGASEYEIELVVISELHDQQLVYLRALNSELFFPIVIGIFEASVIDRHLKGFNSPRPLTHEAASCILTTLGGELEYVLIDRFVDNYWCARLSILQNSQRLTIDLRPSDAFIFALLFKQPIFITEEVANKFFSSKK
jgi:uncharacterized protein